MSLGFLFYFIRMPVFLLLISYVKGTILELAMGSKDVIPDNLAAAVKDVFITTIPETRNIKELFGFWCIIALSSIYTTQKKFRITYYIFFVLAILNPCSYFERDGNCTKLAQYYQWAYGNTSTNFQDDLTFILENCKIRVFPKILR